MKKIIVKSKKYGRFEVLIDNDDYDRVKNITWHISGLTGTKRNTVYVYGYFGKKDNRDVRIPIHRFLLNVPRSLVVDHIDGNGLNNQKANLRICTQKQNILNQAIRSSNKSGYKGVHFCKREHKWVAAISINGKKKFLGYFKTATDGHAAWRKKAKETRGEFYREE